MQSTTTLNIMNIYDKNSTALSIILWPLSIMILGIKNAMNNFAKITLNQNDFTFILGSIVSILAATHYGIQIFKSIRRKKDKNADN